MKRTGAKALGKVVRTRERRFLEVIQMIEAARSRAYQAVNQELIELYWRVGEHISRKIAEAEWGEGVVSDLAAYLKRRHPELRGFARANLFRMRQFYEAYRGHAKVSPLLRQLAWTHHIMILARAKRPPEREFYIRLALQERWSSRQLERQLASALFERSIVSPPKVSALLRQLHPGSGNFFRDTYFLDFLDLPQAHSEGDLQEGLVSNLKNFLVELGSDFCFVGQQYRIQVGGKDFFIDLLFYHRSLQSLVVIDLKIDEFKPEHLGQLQFYLEALDRDVKKSHERPSIGVLLCATKDKEVVEYALSRAASPALIAEYQTSLPDRRLLRRKLHEFYELTLSGKAPRRGRTRRMGVGSSD